MDEAGRKIEIFKPFGDAYELMKKILFQPFDFAKWLVIAFAAFISGSWGFGFNFPTGPFTPKEWKFQSTAHPAFPHVGSMPSWVIGLIIIGVVLGIALMFVMMWVVARGRFVFTNCVVMNRGAIVAPWREYRREGSSFFLFSLAVTFGALALVGVAVVAIVLPLGFFTHEKWSNGFPIMVGVVFLVVFFLWIAFSIFFGLVTAFMIPVMYRRRCLALAAFMDVSTLILAKPIPFILFALFVVVLFIALAIIGTLATCLTCCIGGLPYVSAVLLLPALVWLLAFKLLFLRQFGSEYDVWASIGVADISPSPPDKPPVIPPPLPA